MDTDNKDIPNSVFPDGFEFTSEIMEKLRKVEGITFNEEEIAELSANEIAED